MVSSVKHVLPSLQYEQLLLESQGLGGNLPHPTGQRQLDQGRDQMGDQNKQFSHRRQAYQPIVGQQDCPWIVNCGSICNSPTSRWRSLKGSERLADVITGVVVRDGVAVAKKGRQEVAA